MGKRTTAGMYQAQMMSVDHQGNYVRASSDYNGDLHVSVIADAATNLAIAEILSTYGDIVTLKPKTLFIAGSNPDLDANVAETVWGSGGDETYLTTNTITKVVSTSIDDAESVKIEGHTVADGVFTFSIQTVVLNGRTPVTLATPLARCSKIYNVSGTALAGQITVYDTTGTASGVGVVTPDTSIHNIVVAGDQEASKCATTFSNTDYALITSISGGSGKSTAALLQFNLQIREADGVFRNIYKFGTSTGSVTINLNPYIIVPRNSDVRMTGESNTNNSEGFASFNCLFAATV